jgi:hypothetical protein
MRSSELFEVLKVDKLLILAHDLFANWQLKKFYITKYCFILWLVSTQYFLQTKGGSRIGTLDDDKVIVLTGARSPVGILSHLLHGDYPAIKYVTAAFEKNLVLKPHGADLNLLPRSAADVE